MSLMDMLSRVASRTVATPFGSSAKIIPQISGGDYSVSGADPSRPEKVVRIIRSREQQDGTLEGNRRGSQMVGSVVTTGRSLHVWLSRETYLSLGYEVVKNDHLQLIQEQGEPMFSVEVVDTSDVGDVVLVLSFQDEAL